MADNYNAGQAGHYFSNDDIEQLIKPFTKYTKKRDEKPPGTGEGKPKEGTSNKTTTFKVNEEMPGIKVEKKWVGNNEMYRPTNDSWLAEDTKQNFDYMDAFELTKIAKKTWEGSGAQQRQQKLHERLNPSEATPGTEKKGNNYNPNALIPMSKVEEVVDDPELLELLRSIAGNSGDPNTIENYSLGTFGIRMEE